MRDAFGCVGVVTVGHDLETRALKWSHPAGLDRHWLTTYARDYHLENPWTRAQLSHYLRVRGVAAGAAIHGADLTDTETFLRSRAYRHSMRHADISDYITLPIGPDSDVAAGIIMMTGGKRRVFSDKQRALANVIGVKKSEISLCTRMRKL